MSKPAPIFDNNDAVVDLPPELEGKSPKEIAAYYARREANLRNQLRTPTPPPKKDPPAEEKIDLFNDPTGSINRVVDKKVNERVEQITSQAMPALMESCKGAMRASHPDYGRFAAEIERRVNLLTPDTRIRMDFWEMTYNMVKGEQADAMVAEERHRITNPVEKSTPKGSDPPKPRELSGEEITVARKFGFDNDYYRKASERYEQTDGALPLTMDSRKTRKKAG